MDIFQTIQETATWLEKVNNEFEDNLFRTRELSPKHYYCEIPDEKKSSLVQQIASKKSILLKNANVILIPLEQLDNYGRIMFFDANSTVLDGAPEVESAYYVDIADTPPWDTWIATGQQLNELNIFQTGHELKRDLLIAWVPKSQYFYANEAIEVACLDNFEWGTNNHIRDEYSAIKKLFSVPNFIEQPSAIINHYKRSAILENVQSELIINSKLYYQKFRARIEKKSSFWSKLAIWNR